MGRDLILCPLEFEAAALRRGLPVRAEVVVTGPGPRAAERLRALLAASNGDRPRSVLLAGLCGGLAATPPAPAIDTVIDLDNHRWTPPIRAGGGVTLVGVDTVVRAPADKADLAARTGAALVDTESHHIARVCEELRIPWGVVRAVSDGPGDCLPPGVESWVDEDGRTRPAAAAIACLRRPVMIPDVLALGRRSRAALDALTAAVRATLDVAEAER